MKKNRIVAFSNYKVELYLNKELIADACFDTLEEVKKGLIQVELDFDSYKVIDFSKNEFIKENNE